VRCANGAGGNGGEWVRGCGCGDESADAGSVGRGTAGCERIIVLGP
jgi:hypothetical protein